MSDSGSLVLADRDDGEKLYVDHVRAGGVSIKLERHDDYGFVGVNLSRESVARLAAFLVAGTPPREAE